jgi:hypothetical protein
MVESGVSSLSKNQGLKIVRSGYSINSNDKKDIWFSAHNMFLG